MTSTMARRLARWLVRLLLVAFLAVILGAVTVLIVLPRATHGTALTVLTGSMTPDIPVGSVVIDRPVDPGTLKVGDIATYQKAPGVNEYITHRIVKINTKTKPVTFIFKGDANRGPDITPVPATAIRGKVWFHVPYLGGVRDSLHAGGLRGVAIILAIIGLAGYAIFQFVAWSRSRHAPAAGGPDSLTARLYTAALDGIDVATLAEVLGGKVEQVDGVDGESRTIDFTVSGSADRLDVIRALLDPFGRVIEDAKISPPMPGSAEPADSADLEEESAPRTKRRGRPRPWVGAHRSQVSDE
jgi:signal peptidase